MRQPYIYPYKFPVDPQPTDQLIYLNQLFEKIYISHDNPNGFVAFVYCIPNYLDCTEEFYQIKTFKFR